MTSQPCWTTRLDGSTTLWCSLPMASEGAAPQPGTCYGQPFFLTGRGGEGRGRGRTPYTFCSPPRRRRRYRGEPRAPVPLGQGFSQSQCPSPPSWTDSPKPHLLSLSVTSPDTPLSRATSPSRTSTRYDRVVIGTASPCVAPQAHTHPPRAAQRRAAQRMAAQGQLAPLRI